MFIMKAHISRKKKDLGACVFPIKGGYFLKLKLLLPNDLFPGLLLVTIATEENDGFRQFMHSTKQYDLDVKVSHKNILD